MIELKNVAIGYGTPLVKNINMNFKEGQVYGILGESGNGKSTLLKTISGLVKPMDGQILIDEKEVKKPWNNEIYMMHQNYTCFDWLDALNNILITKKVKSHKISIEDKEDALRALKAVGLDKYEKYYPQQLSGGMRQRLALARTLFMKPKYILMDEPLSALDEKTRREMQQLILKQHKETHNTIIMVTHSKEEAEIMCNQIIYINKN